MLGQNVTGRVSSPAFWTGSCDKDEFYPEPVRINLDPFV